MIIQTKYFGDVDISESKIIQFPKGIPGFIDEQQFVILDMPTQQIFQVLQSVHTSELAFIVTNPYHFYKDYVIQLDDSLQKTLKIENEKDVTVFSIVTLKQPFSTSTLNLRAPIIVNVEEKLAKQYILDRYETKAPMTSKETPKGE